MLDGIPGRIPSYHLLSPLLGLMVSRYPRGYALTSTPEGQELHLHGGEVIKDQLISAPYPPIAYQRPWFQGNGSHLQRVVRRRLAHARTGYNKSVSQKTVIHLSRAQLE